MPEEKDKVKVRKEEIKLMPTKRFLHDPVAFEFLMEFQYGTGEEAKEAEKQIFSESVDGVVVKNMEEFGLVLPDLDFWIDMSRKWRGKEELSLRLYANKDIDSRIAAKYLEQEGFKFEIIELNRENVDIGYIAKLPILINLWTTDESVKEYHNNCWTSLTGVKNFITGELLKKSGVKSHWDYKFEIKSFYGTEKNVTCFNPKREKIYVGPLEKAPHPIEKPLDDYSYKSWHDVGSWEIGNWRKLLETMDDNKIINLETRTVLFLDDIEKLKNREKIVTQEIRHFMEVTYETYFRDEDKLYRLYANMFD